MNFKLSPSDFAFLYEGCKRCFYLKVVHNILQPSIPLPSIFTQIAGLLKSHYNNKRTDQLHSKLPPGIVEYGEKYVTSEIIRLPNRHATCFIKGRFDIAIRFDDNTYGIIDFKTGNPKEESINLYSRQLNAYAYALEHPAPEAMRLAPITKLGLLYFYPSKVSQTDTKWLSYDAEVHFFEVRKDEKGYINFVGEVLKILESYNPPEPNPNGCQWCNYVRRLRL